VADTLPTPDATPIRIVASWETVLVHSCKGGCGTLLEGKVKRCPDCARKHRNAMRKARENILKSCGLVKVRGALGGVYWE